MEEGRKEGQRGDMIDNGNKRKIQRTLNQTRRTSGAEPTAKFKESVSGSYPGYNPKISRVLCVRHRIKLLETLGNQVNNTSKIAMIRFTGAQEKGAMECLEVPQEIMMKGYLWIETLGRSLG